MGITSQKVLICFVGVDGSGKTAHARDLSLFLLKNGYSVKYVHATARPILTYPFLILTRVLGYWNSIKKDVYTDPLENAPSNMKQALGKLYRCLIFVDYGIISLLKIKIPLFFAKILVCDRYVYDLIVDLALSGLHSRKFANVLLLSASRPEKTFFMDTYVGILTQRRPSIARTEMQAKARAYRRLAKILNFRIVRTDGQFKKNQRDIRLEILSMLT